MSKLLIDIEGPNFIGKSTLLPLIKKKLEDGGKKVETHETPAADMKPEPSLRSAMKLLGYHDIKTFYKILLNQYMTNNPITFEQQYLLSQMNRAILIDKYHRLADSFKHHDIGLFSRGGFSTTVYHTLQTGASLKESNAMVNDLVTQIIRTDEKAKEVVQYVSNGDYRKIVYLVLPYDFDKITLYNNRTEVNLASFMNLCNKAYLEAHKELLKTAFENTQVYFKSTLSMDHFVLNKHHMPSLLAIDKLPTTVLDILGYRLAYISYLFQQLGKYLLETENILSHLVEIRFIEAFRMRYELERISATDIANRIADDILKIDSKLQGRK